MTNTTCTCKLCMAVPPEQRPVHKTEADLAPRLDERALESACMAFNNACPSEHWRRRDRMEAAIRAYLAAAPSTRPPEGEVAISPADPLAILAGIKAFGLAPDGADLRDLESALDRLSRENAELKAERDEARQAYQRAQTGFDYHGGRAENEREVRIAAEAQRDAALEVLERAAEALEHISAAGAPFDAKGTHAKRIQSVASEGARAARDFLRTAREGE